MAPAPTPPMAAPGVGLLYDDRMCARATPDGEEHPENPERLRAIWRKLNAATVMSSKLQSEALKDAISQMVGDAKEKNRKFTETVEFQIGLKNYDLQKDKRFTGSVKLPHIPCPKMKVCMLGDAQHVEEDTLLDLEFQGIKDSLLCSR